MQLTEQYRPQTFDDVVGQDKIVAAHRALAKRGLAGRAYWLSGTIRHGEDNNRAPDRQGGCRTIRNQRSERAGTWTMRICPDDGTPDLVHAFSPSDGNNRPRMDTQRSTRTAQADHFPHC